MRPVDKNIIPMRSIALFLLIFFELSFLGCNSRQAEERTGDSTVQVPVPENPEPDSMQNQIDSSSDTSKTIVENIADRADLSMLTAGIESAELTASLTGQGPFTVFAPADTAFSLSGTRIRNAQKPGPDKKMQVLLGYHMVSGFYTTNDLKPGMELTTLQGGKIRITMDNGTYLVNETPITTKNIIAKNGVIHVIEKMLTPPDTLKKK